MRKRSCPANVDFPIPPGTAWTNTHFDNTCQAYVAHYTRAETALEHILRNGTLQLGPLTVTNDPRETKTWVFTVKSGAPNSQEEYDELQRLASRNHEYTGLLKRGCRALCVSCDAPHARKLIFTQRCYGKARMWAQYADNHQGVCLVFDKVLLGQAIAGSQGPGERLVSGEVTYLDFSDLEMGTPEWLTHLDAFGLSGEDLVKEGLERTLRKSRDKHFRTYFFTKNSDWASETEYRWILIGDTDGPEYVEFGDSLKGIVVGCDFPAARLDEVRGHCDRFGAHFARIRWFNGAPDVTWVCPEDLADSPLFA